MRITVRPEGLAEVKRLEALGVDLRRAGTRALNRTISRMHTATLRAVAADTGLAQKDIRRGLAVERATDTRQEASLSMTGRRLPLIVFHARQTRRGVTYRLPGGRGRAPHAFIATMKSGHRGVFQRRGKPRLPINELHGPSLPQVVHTLKLFDAGEAEALYLKDLAHEVDFLLMQRARTGAGAEDVGA